MALGIISADPTGHKELVGLWDGHRESEQTWKDLLLDLKSHGLVQGPAVAIGDGALSFWQALRHVYGKTRGQRCWGARSSAGGDHPLFIWMQCDHTGRSVREL